MRAVIQRVHQAQITIDREETRQTGRFSLNLQIVQSPGLSTH